MPNPSSLPPKPVAEIIRPELTRLPEYTLWRRVLRRVLWLAAQVVVRVCLDLKVRGLEHFPRRGPGLIVLNHLGDADIVVILSQLSSMEVDPLGASDVYDYGWAGKVGDWYGTIWVHRGHPDRRAIACALESLQRGRFVSIAPEGRESLNQGLEPGMEGAAYFALKADVPIIPVTVTGTENDTIYGNLKRWKRSAVTMTVGQPFRLAPSGDRHADLRDGTERIMRELARLLPPEYQGVYRQE